EPAVVAPGDGVPAAKRTTELEHVGRRELRGRVGYRPAIVLEAGPDLAEPHDELVTADPIAVGGRPEAAAERFEPFDGPTVAIREERLDLDGGRGLCFPLVVAA